MTLAETYARALHEAENAPGAETHSVLFRHFVSALKRRGHEKLLPRIGKEYVKILAREGKNAVRVRVAHKKDAAEARKYAASAAEPGTVIGEAVVDESLVSGYSISGPNFRYDASGRSALLQLYKKLTAAN